MLHKPRSYTSDLQVEKQWDMILVLIPNRVGAGHPPPHDPKSILRAIFYVVKTGIQWMNLLSEFPHPKSVYYHYCKWCLDGTWRRINQRLVYLERFRVGRLPYPSAAIMHSQSVKTSLRGGERGFDGNKKIKGRK